MIAVKNVVTFIDKRFLFGRNNSINQNLINQMMLDYLITCYPQNSKLEQLWRKLK